jgi:hypothetical protein
MGLLAPMLLHGSRRNTRTSPAGGARKIVGARCRNGDLPFD